MKNLTPKSFTLLLALGLLVSAFTTQVQAQVSLVEKVEVVATVDPAELMAVRRQK